jgi:hypothetical protein
MKHSYCDIFTAKGLDKLRRLERSNSWVLCGYGFGWICFRYIGKAMDDDG